MIRRTDVFCAGCRAKIRLRIGVGLDERQPLYFVCAKCGAATRGELVIDEEEPSATLFLEGSPPERTEHDDPDQVVTIHPDLPAIVTATEMWDVGGSPFLLQEQLIGDAKKLLEWKERVDGFRGLLKADGPSFKRLSQYYLLHNWKQFDVEGQRIFPDTWPEQSRDFDRHDVYHKIVEIMFMPLVVNRMYLLMKAEFNDYVSRAARAGLDLQDWAYHLRDDVLPHTVQADLVARLHFVMDNFGAMAPAFVLAFYPEDRQGMIDDLRVMRDDFDVLKTHVLSSFELCHKVLAIPVALSNLVERGSWDSFPSGKPRDLQSYAALRNAQKPQYLSSFPVAHSSWNDIFRRTLRNAIGHHWVRHDLASGSLLFDDGTNIPYIRFVEGTLGLTTGLLYAIHLVKMLHITVTISEST